MYLRGEGSRKAPHSQINKLIISLWLSGVGIICIHTPKNKNQYKKTIGERKKYSNYFHGCMSVRETKTGQMIHRALYFKICPIRSFFSLKHHFPVMILVPLRGSTSSQVPSSLLSNLYALICKHYSLFFLCICSLSK